MRREALWVFSNAAHNAFFEDVVDLVKVGWMKIVIDCLESNDVKTLEICMESLHTMFSLGDGRKVNGYGIYGRQNEFCVEFEK